MPDLQGHEGKGRGHGAKAAAARICQAEEGSGIAMEGGMSRKNRWDDFIFVGTMGLVVGVILGIWIVEVALG